MIRNALVLTALAVGFYGYGQWGGTDIYAGGASYSLASFSINGMGYIGGGNPSKNSFYEYDASNQNWTSKGPIAGGVNRASPIAFAINGMGYIGCGGDMGQPSSQTFYSFDPASGNWTKLADFGGGDRHSGFYTSVNGKGYVICGNGASGSNSDVWEYDPAADTWTQKASYPAGALYWPVGFVLNGQIYVCTGANSGTPNMELHAYDPATDSWTKKADFTGPGRSSAVGFAVGGKGYVVGGVDAQFSNISSAYSYDPATDSWQAEPSLDHPSAQTAWNTAFVLGGKVYMVGGAAISSSGISPASAVYEATISNVGLVEQAWTQTALYPNPANDFLYLEERLIREYPDATVTVVSSEGKLVYQTRVDQSIDVSYLTPGLYHVQIHTTDAVLNQKIVVQP